MKTKIMFVLGLLFLPFVSAAYFDVYQFYREDCEQLTNNTYGCVFKMKSNESKLYFIETDEDISARIRAKPFLYEIGKKVWPSKPTYGVYVFVMLVGGLIYYVWRVIYR